MSGTEPPVREGDILAGKYQVERVLGGGGMGVVVAARHVQLRERVALKFLLPHAVQNPEMVERFLREAQAAVRIKSEHVARIIDVGTLESGAPYIVMEHLVGADLSEVLRERGRLPIPEAVDYVLQACEALAEAHALGIVHRDLKPANLFVCRRSDGSPLVKILDFGISKVQSEAGPAAHLTATTSVMGSPLYMSPEQVRSSKTVDARSDVWSMAVTLQELLTGGVPFEGDTVTGLLAMIVADPPIPLRARRPDAPPELEAALLACLAKDPARRVPNVAHLAQLLAPFASPRSRLSVERIAGTLGHGSVPAPPPAGSSPVPAASASSSTSGVGATRTVPPWGHTIPPKRSRAPLVAASAGLVLLLGAGGIALAAFVVKGRNKVEPAAGLVAPSSPPSPVAPVVSLAPPEAVETPGAPSGSAAAPPASTAPVTSTAPATTTAPRAPDARSASNPTKPPPKGSAPAPPPPKPTHDSLIDTRQ